MDPDIKPQLEALHADAFVWAVACCHGDRVEAEDVLQTTYLKIADGRARFGGRSSFKTWLFGVVRNTARELRRRRTARRLLLLKWDAPVSTQPSPDEAVASAQLAAHLRTVLDGLSDRQREVLELVFYHDMTVEEAAGVMDVSVGTARTHYDRGKKAVGARLEELARGEGRYAEVR